MSNSTTSGMFDALQASGLVSQAAAASLNANDIGRAIQAGLGVNAADFESAETYGSIIDVDDSGSIRMRGNSQHLRDGVNLMVAELRSSQSRDDIMLCVRTINDDLIYPFGPLAQAPELTSKNYDPNKGTPLYDAMLTSSGLLLKKWEEARAIGQSFRGSVLWVSDGADEHSKCSARDVRPVIEDLLAREIFLPMFMGIDDGRTKFQDIAMECGIPANLILTPGSSGSEIRKAFSVASRASKMASQGATSFAQVVGGGFGGITV